MSTGVLMGISAAIIIVAFLIVIFTWRHKIKVTYESEWAISLYSGPSPLALKPVTNANPILTAMDVTDVKAGFVADPFLFRNGVAWHLFFEVYNTLSNRGQIGLASSTDGLHFIYERIVLDEPFHVSYPFVFSQGDDIYMMPESAAAGSVRLYKAAPFPYSWTFAGELLQGRFCDSSLVHFKEKWWLFTCFEPSGHQNLHLFFADNLRGPYTEHPKSPIVRGNGHNARPGGRFLVQGESVMRFAQDCQPTYGKSLNAVEITVLTETDYQEHALHGNPIFTASGRGWNRHGMHHLDPHKLEDGSWIAAVDGYKKYVSVHIEY